MKVKLNDKTVYFVAVLNSIFLISLLGVQIFYDTDSYVIAWEKSLSQGIIDDFRTPVYPLFLGLMKSVAGDSFYLLTIIVQHIVFLVSVYYFKQMADWIIQSPFAARCITLIYVIMPATSSWANCILTESFALTGAVFFFYNLLKFYRTPLWSCVWWATFWLVFLIFLRPSFLYLLPASFIAWLLFYYRNRIMAICGILGIIIVSLLEGGYCYKYYKEYGLYAPSYVSVYNQAYLAFKDGLMKPEYTDNTDFKRYIEEFNPYESMYFSFHDLKTFGIITVSKSVQASRKDQPTAWIRELLGRIYRATLTPSLISYMFLICFFVLLVKRTVLNRKLFRISILLYVSFIGNLITVVVGAQADWGRLLVPSLPLFLLLFGEMSNFITLKDNTDDALS